MGNILLRQVLWNSKLALLAYCVIVTTMYAYPYQSSFYSRISGIYPPQIKVYELRELSLKFERHFISEIIDFEVPSLLLYLEQFSYKMFFDTSWKDLACKKLHMLSKEEQCSGCEDVSCELSLWMGIFLHLFLYQSRSQLTVVGSIHVPLSRCKHYSRSFDQNLCCPTSHIFGPCLFVAQETTSLTILLIRINFLLNTLWRGKNLLLLLFIREEPHLLLGFRMMLTWFDLCFLLYCATGFG